MLVNALEVLNFSILLCSGVNLIIELLSNSDDVFVNLFHLPNNLIKVAFEAIWLFSKLFEGTLDDFIWDIVAHHVSYILLDASDHGPHVMLPLWILCDQRCLNCLQDFYNNLNLALLDFFLFLLHFLRRMFFQCRRETRIKSFKDNRKNRLNLCLGLKLFLLIEDLRLHCVAVKFYKGLELAPRYDVLWLHLSYFSYY